MMKNILKTICNVFTGLLVALEIVLVVFLVIMKSSGGVPSLFGYNMYVIVSPSMEPEISVGDVIISREYEGEKLEIGDVITYLGKEGDLAGKIVTHKVIYVSQDGQTIQTQGVANQTPDPEIQSADVRSVLVYKTVIIGPIYSVITSTWGFILLIITPMLLMIGGEVVHLIKVMKEEGEESENVEGD